jgi:hypothetical protein
MPSTLEFPVRQGARRPLLLTVAALLVVVVGLAWAPGRAAADSPVFSFSVTPSTTQAGGHPNLVTDLWVGNRYNQQFPPPTCDCQDPRDVNVEMPTGVIGIPSAAPKCSAADFANQECPPETQVGAAFITINAEPPGTSGFGRIAIFNLEPHPGEAGLLAFTFP